MWKPSKKLVTWILVILLVYNVGTLIAALSKSGRAIDMIPPAWERENKSLLVTKNYQTNLTDELRKVNNNPHIVVYVSDWYADLTLSYRGWEMSTTDEISAAGIRFARSDNNVIVVEPNVTLVPHQSGWFTNSCDLIKNILIPWWQENDYIGAWNRGVYTSLVHELENQQFDNLDFVFTEVSISRYVGFSIWGPINFLIVFGSLIYVRKRWH